MKIFISFLQSQKNPIYIDNTASRLRKPIILVKSLSGVFAWFRVFASIKLTPSLHKQVYNASVEQYRGLCALLVLLAHGFGNEENLIDNFKWPEHLRYAGAGSLSVIIFFCLSGYVIGISNNVQVLNVASYVKKRLIRLYPAYLAAFLLCIILVQRITTLEFWGNLFMLQNGSPYVYLKIPVFVNYPMWTLNFELVYYALFIPLFFIRPKLWHLLGIMLMLSTVLIHSPQTLVFFVSYLNGYYFWILGLLIAWHCNGNNVYKPIPLLSLLFLHCCLNHLSLGMIVLHAIGIDANAGFNSLFDLPFCLLVMTTLTQRDSKILYINKVIVYALPAVAFTYLIFNNRLFENERWPMCLLYWTLALLTLNERKISAFFLNKLTRIGKISYSLYLLHVPVAILIKKTVIIQHKITEVTVKYFLWITLTAALAFIFDLVCQPRIKRLLKVA